MATKPTIPPLQRRQGERVLGAVLLFAVLMAMRYELASLWLRAAAAGCAFAVLGWGLWGISRPRG